MKDMKMKEIMENKTEVRKERKYKRVTSSIEKMNYIQN